LRSVDRDLFMTLRVRIYCTDDETRSQLIIHSYFAYKMFICKGQAERDSLKGEVGMIGT